MDQESLENQFGWSTQVLTPKHGHTHNDGQRSNGASSWTISLSYSIPPSFPFLQGFSFALHQFHWIKHLTTARPFCQNTFFSCYLSYFFCYKTCTGCLEQQQKYNIQFICNFFHLIIINSLIIYQVNPTGVPLLSDCSESNVPNGLGSIWVLVGVRGTNKYRGQDVMKSKTGIFDTL